MGVERPRAERGALALEREERAEGLERELALRRTRGARGTRGAIAFRIAAELFGATRETM